MNTLRKTYTEKLRGVLKEKMNISNIAAVPKLDKVTVNVGLNPSKKDAKHKETVLKTLERITGQKPVLSKAKKSVSGFKIREGMEIGAMVTLRGNRMYDFVQKIISVALPRVRDFSGLSPASFDKQGNYSIGFKEHLVFPEIKTDEVEQIHGLEVVVTTTASSKEEGQVLLEALGFPFKKK